MNCEDTCEDSHYCSYNSSFWFYNMYLYTSVVPVNMLQVYSLHCDVTTTRADTWRDKAVNRYQ